MKAFLAQTRKAIGTAAVLLGAWGTAVLHSKAGGVTTDEWAALIPIGVAVLACYGLTNDPRLTVEEPPTAPLGTFPGKP